MGSLTKKSSEAFIFLFTGHREPTKGRFQALGPLGVAGYQSASVEEPLFSLGFAGALLALP